MRPFHLCAGVALAALAALPDRAPAQPRASAGPAASCPIPAGWSAARAGEADDPYRGNVVVNGIAVLPRGGQRWNGFPIDRDRLRGYLEISDLMRPVPILVLWPDEGAGCADLAETAAFVDSHFGCAPGRCLLADAPTTNPPAPPAPPAPPPPPPGWNR